MKSMLLKKWFSETPTLIKIRRLEAMLYLSWIVNILAITGLIVLFIKEVF